ncbi:chemotaxis protein CheY [Paenibacillus swuensis]|uniref:Chemotaxis protein CheY n=1 Tax=Paenibacillus swuensis TaxID=1178515 RepID=A0A172TGM6_9BACL|nr:response regulator transcription factor [Paenibacillus swuensis]ANE46191.1 chemotaxis protein CheY [Paenibacillus swuensis]
MTEPFRVIIVDDHEHAREGMRDIVGMDPSFHIVAEGRNGVEALELTERWMPDLLLMDIQMPDMDGLEATKRIKERFPYVKIVLVTVSDDVTHLFEALRKGAQGYLLKNLQPSAWHEYLRAIAIDEAPMSKEVAGKLLREFSPATSKSAEVPAVQEGITRLTGREREILECVASGQSNRDVAAALSISEHTVKNHLKNILQKLHLDNRVQLTRYAFEQGWINR